MPARYPCGSILFRVVIALLARQVLGDRELGEAAVGVEVAERGKVELEVLAADYG